LEALVGWSSKKQQTVLLSSKAEYISYGEVCQEAMFMNQLLLKELLKSNISVVIYGDNQGVLYLVKTGKPDSACSTLTYISILFETYRDKGR